MARGGGKATPGEPPPGDPEKNSAQKLNFFFSDILLNCTYGYSIITYMKDKINNELHAIAENLPQYVRMARYEMFASDTSRASHDADDVVSQCMITYIEKLQAGKMYLATSDNHAQARFTLFVKNALRNLWRKRWKESHAEDIDASAITVDAQTFDATLDLLEQAKAKLKPRDTARLERILNGESRYDIMPCADMRYNFRARVRDVYNAL